MWNNKIECLRREFFMRWWWLLESSLRTANGGAGGRRMKNERLKASIQHAVRAKFNKYHYAIVTLQKQHYPANQQITRRAFYAPLLEVFFSSRSTQQRAISFNRDLHKAIILLYWWENRANLWCPISGIISCWSLIFPVRLFAQSLIDRRDVFDLIKSL